MSAEPKDGRTAADFDKAGQDAIEGRPAEPGPDGETGARPAAGSHAEPALTNPDATPGSGALPSASPDDEADAATG